MSVLLEVEVILQVLVDWFQLFAATALLVGADNLHSQATSCTSMYKDNINIILTQIILCSDQ